ncbi:hypothetical protein HETIRDRAFT_117068 [Heterobasidion irregulare TC 32-1]|uniref:Uncharacterized protein n=1 Tax=Heterobasidion irregulare (strain TC 32-1) TaxID=747525 RepID=W4K2H5_HETIT|nr:uncharacterized protein HETIRDRAFT_117068 [Heterobasidion irregulare TC 32-1]ETW79929.1 hypothetical protein HETIRDRAFT_117068 [Heterobasidion irregulare TC 32-1]
MYTLLGGFRLMKGFGSLLVERFLVLGMQWGMLYKLDSPELGDDDCKLSESSEDSSNIEVSAFLVTINGVWVDIFGVRTLSKFYECCNVFLREVDWSSIVNINGILGLLVKQSPKKGNPILLLKLKK